MRVAMAVFLLTFLVGAAFAFVPGTLTIGGNVSIEPTDAFVRWNTAVVSSSPASIEVTQLITYGGGREAQHIEWDVTFDQPGETTLTVTALNSHDVLSALLATPAVTYNGGYAAAHGLTITPNFGNLTGPLGNAVAGVYTISQEGTITVAWDGTLPPGFDATADGTNPVLTISVAIGYTAINP